MGVDVDFQDWTGTRAHYGKTCGDTDSEKRDPGGEINSGAESTTRNEVPSAKNRTHGLRSERGREMLVLRVQNTVLRIYSTKSKMRASKERRCCRWD